MHLYITESKNRGFSVALISRPFDGYVCKRKTQPLYQRLSASMANADIIDTMNTLPDKSLARV